jgi:hypothetical protein
MVLRSALRDPALGGLGLFTVERTPQPDFRPLLAQALSSPRPELDRLSRDAFISA